MLWNIHDFYCQINLVNKRRNGWFKRQTELSYFWHVQWLGDQEVKNKSFGFNIFSLGGFSEWRRQRMLNLQDVWRESEEVPEEWKSIKGKCGDSRQQAHVSAFNW